MMHDATVLTQPSPDVPEERAREAVRRWFGVDGALTALTGERDRNFHLKATDGRAYLLKFVNAAEPVSVTRFQNGVLMHMAGSDPGLTVPRVIPTLDGSAMALEPQPDGSGRIIRLLTWMEGTPWAKVARSPAQRKAMGRMLARLDRALDGAPPEGAPTDLLWDLRRAPDLVSLLVHIPDDGRRALAAEMLRRFTENVLPHLAAMPQQAIHNDFNPSNVLVASDDHDAVAGVIDFGDMVVGPVLNDVAVAAAYHVEAEGDFLTPLTEFVGAYHAVNPLPRDHAGLLMDAITMRMAITVIIASWRAGLQPDNADYILRNAGRAWIGLQRAADLTPGQARDAFLAVME